MKFMELVVIFCICGVFIVNWVIVFFNIKKVLNVKFNIRYILVNLDLSGWDWDGFILGLLLIMLKEVIGFMSLEVWKDEVSEGVVRE